MYKRQQLRFDTRPGFSVGVVLTLPPFPHRDRYEELSKGLPVLFRGEPTQEDWSHIHFDEVELRDGQFFTSGFAGYLGIVTGCGGSVKAARERAYGLARRIVVPNIRYRSDIGQRFLASEKQKLQAWGFWPR